VGVNREKFVRGECKEQWGKEVPGFGGGDARGVLVKDKGGR